MALADLLLTLERDAAARAEARLAAVRAEAERLTGDHAAELARRRQQVLAVREQVLAAEDERSVVTATRDAERTRLLARHELLARVHDRARHSLVQRAGTATGRAAIGALVARALPYLGDGAGAASITPQPTGSNVAASDSRLEVDATLEGVLERMWPGLAMDIIQRAELPR